MRRASAPIVPLMVRISAADISALVAHAGSTRVLDETEQARLVGRCASGQDAALEALDAIKGAMAS